MKKQKFKFLRTLSFFTLTLGCVQGIINHLNGFNESNKELKTNYSNLRNNFIETKDKFGEEIKHVNMCASENYSDYSPYIDYSGINPKIDYPIVSDDKTLFNNDFLYVPVYRGRYKESTWWDRMWNFSTWSNWSPNNYRSSDYFTYRGETTTVYEVQSKTEYHTYHSVKQNVYKDKYITTFQGSKWWNFFIFYSVSSDYGFADAPSNYKVYKKETKKVVSYSYYVNKYEWRDNVPRGWNYSETRTTYRYRTWKTHWDKYTNSQYTALPLKYSLYKKDSFDPIGFGIKWNINWDISNLEEAKKSWFREYILQESRYFERGINTTLYHLPKSELIPILADIVNKKSVDWIRTIVVSLISELVGSFVNIHGAGIAVSLLDSLVQHLKNKEINEFSSKFNEALGLDSNINPVFIIEYNTFNFTNDGHPIPPVMKIYLDTNHKGFVSLLYDTEKANSLGFYSSYSSYSDKVDYIGDITYIFNYNNLRDMVEQYVSRWF